MFGSRKKLLSGTRQNGWRELTLGERFSVVKYHLIRESQRSKHAAIQASRADGLESLSWRKIVRAWASGEKKEIVRFSEWNENRRREAGEVTWNENSWKLLRTGDALRAQSFFLERLVDLLWMDIFIGEQFSDYMLWGKKSKGPRWSKENRVKNLGPIFICNHQIGEWKASEVKKERVKNDLEWLAPSILLRETENAIWWTIHWFILKFP